MIRNAARWASVKQVATTLYDDFNRANGALGISPFGQPWSNDGPKDLIISSNEAILTPGSPTGGSGNSYASIEVGYSNVLVEATLTGSDTNGWAGVLARSNQTSWIAAIYQRNVSGLFLAFPGGVGDVNTSVTVNVPFTLGLRCVGTNISVEVDGVVRLSKTSALNQSETRCGIAFGQSSGNNTSPYHIDDFLVTPQ